MIEHRASLYYRHRFSAEIIAESVWLYYRFPLSFRMIEDMLAYHGILATQWHLDECVISIKGEKHWLWRAVDQDGFVLEVLVQKRRNTKAAKCSSASFYPVRAVHHVS